MNFCTQLLVPIRCQNNCKDIFLFVLEVGYLEALASVCNKLAESIVPCQLKHYLRRVGFWLTMAPVLDGLAGSTILV